MRIDIGELHDGDIGATQAFSLRQATFRLSESLALRQVEASGNLMLLESNILLKGLVSGEIMLTCSRCLTTFPYQLRVDLAEEFTARPVENQWAYSGQTIDLRPMLREVLLLALPSRPLHDEGCQGLCPVCGKNLNEQPHRHRQAKSENVFAVLKKGKKL